MCMYICTVIYAYSFYNCSSDKAYKYVYSNIFKPIEADCVGTPERKWIIEILLLINLTFDILLSNTFYMVFILFFLDQNFVKPYNFRNALSFCSMTLCYLKQLRMIFKRAKLRSCIKFEARLYLKLLCITPSTFMRLYVLSRHYGKICTFRNVHWTRVTPFQSHNWHDINKGYNIYFS